MHGARTLLPLAAPPSLVFLALASTACFNPPPVDDTSPGTTSTTGVSTGPGSSDGTTTGSTTGSTTAVDSTTAAVDSSSSGVPDPDSSSGTTVFEDDTIYEIQDGTIATGQAVDVRGVIVTAVAMEGMFVQELPGGEYSGVFVVTAGDPGVARGDEVDLTGTVAEVMGMTVIDVASGTVDTTGGSGIELDPEVVPAAGLTAAAEPWEGVLLRVEGAPLEVTSLPPFGFSVVTNGETVDVSDRIYDVTTEPMMFPGFGLQASFTAIQGPLTETPMGYQLVPRDALDLEGYAPPLLPEVFGFPTAGDASMFQNGTLPWNAGDYYEGLRVTMLPIIYSVDVHIDVVSNGLSACGFQDADVIVNGVTVGNFTVQQGTVVIDQSYMIPMGLVGPMFTVRYETTATVASGCGAAGYSLDTSTITFNP